MRTRLTVRLLVSAAVACTLLAQGGAPPVLNPALEAGSAVTGKAAPGSGPITVYDLSYAVRTKIGVAGTLDRDGNFAAALKARLILGHRIVAVDRLGSASAPVIVTAAPRTAADR